MGIAKDFNKVLHGQINVHAAWLPVTNTFALGDFGVISDGVFVRMGSITSDFGVSFQSRPGRVAPLDFESNDVRLSRFAAGATVSAFSAEEIDARLKIEFGRERSFYLKATLAVSEMESPFKAAQQLAAKPDWDAGKFKVVSATYTGKGCAILSSRKGNASVVIGGKAPALKTLELGAAEGGLSFSSTSGMGLEILGGTGVVGLSLFRLERGGGPRFEAVGEVSISDSSSWGADLDDDI